jgi:hypothetical protein
MLLADSRKRKRAGCTSRCALVLAALLAARPARGNPQQVVGGLTTFDPYGLLTITMPAGTPSMCQAGLVTGWSKAVVIEEWRPPLPGSASTSWVSAQRVTLPALMTDASPLITLSGLCQPTPTREGIGTTALDGETAVFAGYNVKQETSLPSQVLTRTVATVRADGSVLLTEIRVVIASVTRGAAAVNGSSAVYVATDNNLLYVDAVSAGTTGSAMPSPSPVGGPSRPFHPLILGGLAPGGGTGPDNWALYTMGFAGSLGTTCNCNGLWSFNLGAAPLPTTPLGFAYEPATDRGGGPSSKSNQAGWFRSRTEYFACDNSQNELARFTSASPGAAWVFSWSVTFGGAPCYSVTGRVEGGHTILYAVVGGLAPPANEASYNSVHRINATTQTDTIIFGSIPSETFRSAFFSPCAAFAQGALGLPCPTWLNGVSYIANATSGGVPPPSPSPTPSVTASISLTASTSFSPSETPSNTPTPSGTPSTGASLSSTPSVTPTASASRNVSATATPSTSTSFPPNTSRSPSSTPTFQRAAGVTGGTSSEAAPSVSAGAILGGGFGGCIVLTLSCLFCKRWAERKGNSAHRQRRGCLDILFGVSPPVATSFAPADHPIFSVIEAQREADAFAAATASSSSSGGAGGDEGEDAGGADALVARAVSSRRAAALAATRAAAASAGGGPKRLGAAPVRQPSSLTAPMSAARAAAFARVASGALDPAMDPLAVPEPAALARQPSGLGGSRSLTSKAAFEPSTKRAFAGGGSASSSAAAKKAILSGAK